MAGILRNFQPALKNGFLKIKKTCILWAQGSENVSNVKIGQNDFDVFFRTVLENCSEFRLFCNKDIFWIICLNYEIPIMLVCRSIFFFFFFSKNFNVK